MPELPSGTLADRLPVLVYRLGEEPGDDLSATTTPEQRLEMVDILSERMWALAGVPRPNIRRADLPGRICRPA